MWGWFRKKPKYGGKIKYFGLEEWWEGSFSDEERREIRRRIEAMFQSSEIDKGDILSTSQEKISYLTGIGAVLNEDSNRHLADRFFEKADEFFDESQSVFAKHFAMQSKCGFYYRLREKDPTALDKAIEACEMSLLVSKQAAQAFLDDGLDFVPSHHCLKQYAIIEEKRGNFRKALALSLRAKDEGWSGDWDARIKRLQMKMDKE
nr:hypothetical protein [Brucella intermedia]